jgi:hypothetical protein
LLPQPLDQTYPSYDPYEQYCIGVAKREFRHLAFEMEERTKEKKKEKRKGFTG